MALVREAPSGPILFAVGSGFQIRRSFAVLNNDGNNGAKAIPNDQSFLPLGLDGVTFLEVEMQNVSPDRRYAIEVAALIAALDTPTETTSACSIKMEFSNDGGTVWNVAGTIPANLAGAGAGTGGSTTVQVRTPPGSFVSDASQPLKVRASVNAFNFGAPPTNLDGLLWLAPPAVEGAGGASYIELVEEIA